MVVSILNSSVSAVLLSHRISQFHLTQSKDSKHQEKVNNLYDLNEKCESDRIEEVLVHQHNRSEAHHTT